MTEIQPYAPPSNGAVTAWTRPGGVPAVANRAVVSLTEWAEAARAAHEVSEVLVRTPFVPDAYRDNPYAATAAILAGDEVGLSPMAAINAYDVIQGRAAPKALTLRAIVQSRGHEVWTEETTDSRCVVRGRRAGSSLVQESVWTIQRARTMKLAGKPNWQLQPQAMLLARATAECCRMIAADAILGIPFASEEVADDVAAAAEQEAPAGPQRTAQRRQAPRAAAPAEQAPRASAPKRGAAAPAAADPAADGPPLPGEDGYDEPAADEPAPGPAETDPSTRPQNRKMHALFRDAEVTDRGERLSLTGLLLGRKLDTSAGLTVADANVVIDALERLSASGHAEGLAGAVNDLLNNAALAEAEQAQGGEQAGADDDARDES